ncbi:hypothetical protein Hanom_Chr12g01081851 [Helianthus anomalus]
MWLFNSVFLYGTALTNFPPSFGSQESQHLSYLYASLVSDALFLEKVQASITSIL